MSSNDASTMDVGGGGDGGVSITPDSTRELEEKKASPAKTTVTTSTTATTITITGATALKREHDSVDDFEHLEHESSPLREDRDETSWQREEEERKLQDPQQQHRPQLVDVARVGDLIDITVPFERNLTKSSTEDNESRTVPATPPPSADFEKCEAMARTSDPFQRSEFAGSQIDPKLASMAFMETERSYAPGNRTSDIFEAENLSSTAGNATAAATTTTKTATTTTTSTDLISGETNESKGVASTGSISRETEGQTLERPKDVDETFVSEIRSSVLPVPQKSPSIDFLADEPSPSPLPPAPPSSNTFFEDEKRKNLVDVDESSWNVVERPPPPPPPPVKTTTEDQRQNLEEALTNRKEEESRRATETGKDEPPTKELPPLPKESNFEAFHGGKFEGVTKDKGSSALPTRRRSGAETGDSEFESEPEASPAKKPRTPEEKNLPLRFSSSPPASRNPIDLEIAPKKIFSDMGLDAWFNPERLNPQVAALIYWRDPKESGIVFGAILGLLLSLAYLSLISVFAYSSILVLAITISIRIYKTVLQAVQKTSDGHPFKDILELDLHLPAEKVHEVADVAVAHANAAVSELRRLFLVEDFVDSLKFGVLLWCLTYVGSMFNGMTLVIIAVVALFTLPKVYETNKAQIDENLALGREKIDEITVKIKAAIPLGKKRETAKEE